MDQGGGELDTALVVRAQLGDADAFAALVERHLAELHDHVARIVGDPATDLAVVTFGAVLDRLGWLRDAQRFRPWLYRVAGELLEEVPRTPLSQGSYGSAPEQRSVSREFGRLSLPQARAVDLAVRRGMAPDELRTAMGQQPDRHLRRALRRLDGLTDDGWAVLDSLPPVPGPDPRLVAAQLRRRWSAAPGAPPRPSHHGLVVWGAGVAAALLSMLVPALVGSFPIERQATIASAEYTAAPFAEASGVETFRPEEPETEVLPTLPPYELDTDDPEPEPEPPPPPAPSPTPSPSPSPSPEPPPPTEPSEEPECGPVEELLSPCPSETDEPSPTESPTSTESSPSEQET